MNMGQKKASPQSHLYLVLVLVLCISFQLHLSISLESDSISPGERLAGNHTLTSKGGVFEMGFFVPPGNSHSYYIGIWYNYKLFPMPEKTVVWVANRDRPISDPHSAWLELLEDGNLVLRTSSGLAVWSTNSNSTAPPSNSTALGTLGDDGNFIIRERSNHLSTAKDRKTWQSFEHTTDTLLPGAKFGYDKVTGITTVLTPWNDTSNPAPGNFYAKVSDNGNHILLNYTDYMEYETSFCKIDYDIGLAYPCGSINFSDTYMVVVYSSSSYPPTCLLRYVLDVEAREPQLFVWFPNYWHLIKMESSRQPCELGPRIPILKEDHDDNRENAKESGKKIATWIVILASIEFLAPSFIVITVVLIIARRKRSGTSTEAPGGDALEQYKHRDLQRATKNFTHKLGKVGFSTVYKGEFHDSTFIAVKELRGNLHEEKQLRAELNTIGLIQHKNLVRLRGFCLDNSKRFIVYDYMPNGSLDSHLFQEGTNFLDWGTRYNIALGTAKGLAYLHEECRDCIIHCDIKPENILLDAEFNPKIADFGMAKLLCRDFSRVLTTMRGTRGYLAPEWFSGVPVTAKVDVYSYGQVLFEIISGRRNMNLLNDELNSYFPALILNALNNKADVVPLVDSKLEAEVNVEELTRACKIACWCIQDDEKDRPTMKQVVQILEGLLDVGTPPIPQFFQSIAEVSPKESDIKDIEAYSYSTSSTLATSFTFQPPAQPIQHVP